MDKEEHRHGGEISMSEKRATAAREVLISISNEETPKTNIDTPNLKASDSLDPETVSRPSPEISRFSPSPNNPLKIPMTGEHLTRNNSTTMETPLMESPGRPSEDEDEEIYKRVPLGKQNNTRVRVKATIDLVLFLSILGCLVSSLTIEKLEKTKIWGLEFWKWCLLVMVIFCGKLIAKCFMNFIVFLIERNFLLRKKVLYLVYGLKSSLLVSFWIFLILLVWVLLFNHGVARSNTATEILHYITKTLILLLIGSFFWLSKTLMLMKLSSSFYLGAFFDRIQESVFHQYVLQTLSGPPLMEEAERVGKSPSSGQLSFERTKKGKETKDKMVIDLENVRKMKQEKVSAWTMKILGDAITTSNLSTNLNDLDEVGDREITSEWEAIAAAHKIFCNVVQTGSKYISEEDLLRFMIKEEVDLLFPLIEGSFTERISKKALKNWVVKAYRDRKMLACTLKDTKVVVKQLNKLVRGILVVVFIIIWLRLMKIATTTELFTPLLGAAFVFGNTCKSIFESIIFVFVVHPFDVGDRCVVDGTQLLVEEMNILTTVFLKVDNEKVYYPNSVLINKPISNYNRSPDMGETVEFSIDFATFVEKMGMLKKKIKMYLEMKPQYWYPKHNVVVRETDNDNKLKMIVYCNHTINFQDFAERDNRRTELVIEIKKIFEELGIKYYRLLQQAPTNPNHVVSEPIDPTSGVVLLSADD